MTDRPMSILEHLEALRRVLIVSVIAIIPGAVIGWFIREDILRVLIRPVTGMHYKLVYITPTEALTTEIKIAILAGFVLAMPVIAYQLWRFVLPALHANEKRYIMIFVPLSVALFVIGIAFGYYSVFLYGVQFLLSFGGEGLTPMLSLGKYLSFSLWFLIPFGVMFELPLVILLLVRIGIVSPKFLAAKRAWVLVVAFVVSAIATPTTDMLSQSVMAGAIYILYEISIWISYFVRPKKSAPEAIADVPQKSVPVVEADGSAVPGRVPHLVSSDQGAAGQLVGDGTKKGESDPAESTRIESGAVESDGGVSPDSGQDKGLEEIYRDIVDRGNKDK